MHTTRRWVRNDGEKRCHVALEFSDIDPAVPLSHPVSGHVKVSLNGDGITHPVELGITDIEQAGSNAAYAEFETWNVQITDQDDYPVFFPFTTHPSDGGGGKWYYYKTGDWNPDSDVDPYHDPGFVKHHIGIPSSQKIRLVHRILAGEADVKTIDYIKALYGGNAVKAASSFSRDVKKYVGFESRVEIQDFLIAAAGMRRSYQDSVNKVAKQLTVEEYEHRTTSLDDVEDMVTAINDRDNFPTISVEDVFREVVDRSTDNELMTIADRLGIDDWFVVFSK